MIRIYIDQGHNPVNPNAGAEVEGVREQDINYEVGVRLSRLLRTNGNFAVRLSRNTPETILGVDNNSSLMARVNEANAWPADYFISLHCNSNPNPVFSGCEAYVYRLNSRAEELAEEILEGISDRMGIRDRGVFAGNFLVLRRTTMPAVLVEMGYLTNPRDRELLVNDPQGFAQGIYNGIVDELL